MNELIAKETMTSKEIAEITGKRHSDVLRDIRNLVEQLEDGNERNFALVEYTDGKGEKRPMYELSKKGCLCLASGYDANLRMKIINRWEELEMKEINKFQVPTTFAEALRLAAEKKERKNKKISAALKGHSVTDETKKKISETIRNKQLPKDEELNGVRMGRLVIIEEIGRRIKPCGQKERMIRCKCDCGKIVEVRLSSFINGKVKSCGCLRMDEFSKNIRKHGLSSTKIHNVYRGIKNRCYNKNCDEYNNYGGRGIKMCDKWRLDFTSFYNWVINNGYDSNKTIKEQSIDRIDVNGDYEPSNCRIVNCSTQARNKRNTKRYLYIGELLDLKTISEKTGINYNTLWQRINKYGYTLDNALF